MIEVSKLRHALSFFEDFHEYDWPDEDIILPVLQRPDVLELLDCLALKPDSYGYVDKRELQAQIIAAYKDDEAVWWQLNATWNGKELKECEEGFGLHCAGICLWVELYPEVAPYLTTCEHYHPEMLKLLVKRLIWDVVFAGETLPNYTEPTDGWLPHMQHLKPES